MIWSISTLEFLIKVKNKESFIFFQYCHKRGLNNIFIREKEILLQQFPFKERYFAWRVSWVTI